MFTPFRNILSFILSLLLFGGVIGVSFHHHADGHDTENSGLCSLCIVHKNLVSTDVITSLETFPNPGNLLVLPFKTTFRIQTFTVNVLSRGPPAI